MVKQRVVDIRDSQPHHVSDEAWWSLVRGCTPSTQPDRRWLREPLVSGLCAVRVRGGAFRDIAESLQTPSVSSFADHRASGGALSFPLIAATVFERRAKFWSGRLRFDALASRFRGCGRPLPDGRHPCGLTSASPGRIGNMRSHRRWLAAALDSSRSFVACVGGRGLGRTGEQDLRPPARHTRKGFRPMCFIVSLQFWFTQG